jgi:hypothetical protein
LFCIGWLVLTPATARRKRKNTDVAFLQFSSDFCAKFLNYCNFYPVLTSLTVAEWFPLRFSGELAAKDCWNRRSKENYEPQVLRGPCTGLRSRCFFLSCQLFLGPTLKFKPNSSQPSLIIPESVRSRLDGVILAINRVIRFPPKRQHATFAEKAIWADQSSKRFDSKRRSVLLQTYWRNLQRLWVSSTLIYSVIVSFSFIASYLTRNSIILPKNWNRAKWICEQLVCAWFRFSRWDLKRECARGVKCPPPL